MVEPRSVIPLPVTLDFMELARDVTTSVLTSSTEIAPANKNRTILELVNDGVNVIYLAKGKTAVANQGIRLNANGGSYTIDHNNMYKGQINAIAISATTVLVGEETETRYPS